MRIEVPDSKRNPSGCRKIVKRNVIGFFFLRVDSSRKS